MIGRTHELRSAVGVSSCGCHARRCTTARGTGRGSGADAPPGRTAPAEAGCPEDRSGRHAPEPSANPGQRLAAAATSGDGRQVVTERSRCWRGPPGRRPNVGFSKLGGPLAYSRMGRSGARVLDHPGIAITAGRRSARGWSLISLIWLRLLGSNQRPAD
jgi:hypothetical protein